VAVHAPRRTARRRELLAIAAELFAARGFANVTVDEIGDAAGVSGPALYHHFASKEALLGEMLIDISQYLLDGGRAVAAGSPGTESPDAEHDVIERLVRFHAEFAVRDRALITLHFRDLVHATADDQRTVRRLQSQYAAIWSHAVRARRPNVDRRTAEAAVHAAFGLINSTPFSGRVANTQMTDLLSAMAIAAIAAVVAD
jgi:AcrR family transcriptional regulator